MSLRFTTVLLAVAMAQPAFAEDVGGLANAPQIRKELLLRGGRHEAQAGLNISLGDAFVRGWAPSFGYAYYLTNWFGVGADFSYNACAALGDTCKTALTERIEARQRGGTLDDLSVLTFSINPTATLVPISGKLGILGTHVVHWDVHLLIGAAIVGTDNLGEGTAIEASTKVAPLIGLGQRFYLGRSMAITVALRDTILQRVLNSATAGAITGAAAVEEEIENRVMLSISAAFYFPPAVKTGQ